MESPVINIGAAVSVKNFPRLRPMALQATHAMYPRRISKQGVSEMNWAKTV